MVFLEKGIHRLRVDGLPGSRHGEYPVFIDYLFLVNLGHVWAFTDGCIYGAMYSAWTL